MKQKDAEIKLKDDALESEQKKVEDLNKLLAGGDDAKKALAEANNQINEKDKEILQLRKDLSEAKELNTQKDNELNGLKNSLQKAADDVTTLNKILGFDIRTAEQDEIKDVKLKMKLGEVLRTVLEQCGVKKKNCKIYKTWYGKDEGQVVEFDLFGPIYLKKLLNKEDKKQLSMSEDWGYFTQFTSYKGLQNKLSAKVGINDQGYKGSTEAFLKHYLYGLANVTILLANKLSKVYELKHEDMDSSNLYWLKMIDKYNSPKLTSKPQHYYIENIENIKD